MSMQEMTAVITRFRTATDALAVSAARVWPECTVTGIDVWEPSLELARRNVTAAGLDHRIEIRRQDMQDLDDTDRYDCGWVPSFFFGHEVIAAAPPKIITSARPDGQVVMAHYEPPPDPCRGPRCACAPSATAGPCSTRTVRPNCCAAQAARTCTR